MKGWLARLGQHAAIAEHLCDGDLLGAVAALKTNWTNGMERMLSRIPED